VNGLNRLGGDCLFTKFSPEGVHFHRAMNRLHGQIGTTTN